VQPADIAIALRRRSPWEAMDLGLSMLQRWGRLVYVPHLAVFAATTACAFGLAWWLERPWVALLAVWWLKPIGERVVLHVLSRAVFGERLGWRAVLSQHRQWLFPGLLPGVLLRWWPNLARSFYLPVRQLEGSRGRERRARREVLGRRARGSAVWLTIVCLHFETVLLWSAGALTQLLLPAQLERHRGDQLPFVGGFFDWAAAATVGDGLVFVAVWLLLEPFYVAAGFALYLNRRTQLEGWDIEVALRRIAERHAAALAAVLLCFACTFIPGHGYAQEKNPRTEIAEVLKAPEFGHYRETKRWQMRPSGDDKSDGSSLWERFWKWLLGKRSGEKEDTGSGIGYAIARALEVLFWILIAAAAAYLLWWASKLLPRALEPRREPYRPPAALFGMDLSPDKLPPDVAAAAAGLAREGRLREALSLLYRGALTELVHKRGVQLLPSHTEGEAVRLAGMPYFAGLVEVWRACAYGQRPLSATRVEELAAGYREAFA
jgi:hypothetical protein